MTTERDIIYTIWKIVRGGTVNQDDPINERLMRDFLRIHRGTLLNKAYSGGYEITEDAYQDLGNVDFRVRNGVFESINQAPPIIRLNNFGILANIDDYQISVVNSEDFESARYDKFNKFHPMMKYVNNRFYISFGQEQNCVGGNENSPLNRAVRKLRGSIISDNEDRVRVRAILINPDDQPGYDFTKSPYPLPNELVESLINSVNAREFNLFLQTRSDEVGDNRNNNGSFNTREEV